MAWLNPICRKQRSEKESLLRRGVMLLQEALRLGRWHAVRGTRPNHLCGFKPHISADCRWRVFKGGWRYLITALLAFSSRPYAFSFLIRQIYSTDYYFRASDIMRVMSEFACYCLLGAIGLATIEVSCKGHSSICSELPYLRKDLVSCTWYLVSGNCHSVFVW